VGDGGAGSDDRTCLHEIVDALPDDELSVARQLLELLAKGRARPMAGSDVYVNPAEMGADDDDDQEDDADERGSPVPSPETITKLAQLSDDELLRLDDLLESDPATAKTFWRERFGEELEDDSLTSL